MISAIKYVLLTTAIIAFSCRSVAQVAAIGNLESRKISAGQTFTVKVHLSVAPSYESFLQEAFDPASGVGNTVSCYAPITPGVQDFSLSCPIPFDADGGIYVPRSKLRMGAPKGGNKERTLDISLPTIEIIALPDTNVYPDKAVATLVLSQQQILQNGAAKIESLLDQLNTKIDSNSAETPAFKQYLASIAFAGQQELEKNRAEYRKAAESEEPIFFEDLRRHYAAFLIDVRAPRKAAITTDDLLYQHIKLVQLTSNQNITVTSSSLSSSLGPYATQLAKLLGDHMAAFLQVGKTGSTNFTISLKSSPPGASVSYKRIGEEYRDYSKQTDIEQAVFPYALWTFRFTLGRCEVVKNPDPYIEKSPNLNPSMLNCVKK